MGSVTPRVFTVETKDVTNITVMAFCGSIKRHSGQEVNHNLHSTTF
jgi:hypothetical protein